MVCVDVFIGVRGKGFLKKNILKGFRVRE